MLCIWLILNFVFIGNRVGFVSAYDFNVSYSTLFRGEGWQTNLTNIEETKKFKDNLEAIRIELTDGKEKDYNIFYRVYLENYGWLVWARNGETAGNIGANLKIKETQVKVFPNDIIPDLEKSPTLATLIFDISNEQKYKIDKAGGYRSNTISIYSKENGKKFFKMPEYNVRSHLNKNVWELLNIREDKDTKIRNVAASRVEKLLGISNIIAKSEFAIIRRKGQPNVQGALVENVDGGMDFLPYRSNIGNKTLSPSLQRSLSNLEIFDALTSQIDRVPWNYSIITSNNTKRAVRVVGYDQDLTFGNITDLKSGHFVLPPIITSDNKIALPYMDKTFANRILNITDNQIRATLFDTLEPQYVEATVVRLNKLKNAIKKTIASNSHFLLDENEWSQKTIDDELNCQYPTYLKLFKYYIIKPSKI